MAGGETVEEMCKGPGIRPATQHQWQKENGGAGVDTERKYPRCANSRSYPMAEYSGGAGMG